MKFYIISIILNIIALFVPVVYYTSGGGGKGKEQDETVTVNLNENVFNDTSQGAGQKSDGAGISAKGNDHTGIQQTSPVSQPQEKINTVNSQNNQKVDTVSPVSQNKTEQPKASKSDNKPPVSQGSSLSAVQPSGNTGKTVQSSGNSSGNTNSSVSGSGNCCCIFNFLIILLHILITDDIFILLWLRRCTYLLNSCIFFIST